MSRLLITGAMFAAALSAGLLVVQSAGAQSPAKLTMAERAEVIDSLAFYLRKEYAFADVAERLAQTLIVRQRKGAYESLTDPSAFAEAITAEMRATAHDRHLDLTFSEEEVPAGPRRPPPSGAASPFAPYNYFFERVERLSGNIGYLKINGFVEPSSGGGDVAAAAMAFLASTDALLIDLRDNEGGRPAMGALLTAYLLDSAAVHLTDIHWREAERVDQLWSPSFVAGRHYVGKDVYLLVNRGTFSAAEGFVYDLQARKRAMVVGDTTGGGANPGFMQRVSAHFASFIPRGYTVSPLTGRSWEGVGVIPDVVTQSDSAYNVAYGRALTKLLEKSRGRSLDEETKATLARLSK